MKRFRLATVVSLLYLGSLAMPASAECAWVLWSNQVGQRVQLYSVHSAHGSKSECEREATTFTDVLKSQGYEVKASQREVIGSQGRTDNTLLPLCLPDTVDPRAPKGGR